MISIIVAYSHNRVIGRDGRLPWDLPSDRRRFRDLTLGHTVVMGRRTFESLPGRFRPLPDRRNVVVSGGGNDVAPGAEVYPSVIDALGCDEDCFVIGGEGVYAEALPRACRVYATEISQGVAGDVFFPVLGREKWRVACRHPLVSENDYNYRFVTYERQASL